MIQESGAFHRLKSFEVVGGFLDGLKLEFQAGLNCLIGHRGTGKTSVLEFVRYALDSFPKGDTGKELRKRVEGLVKSNLGDGRIRLMIQTKDGLDYIVDRTASGQPMVLTAEGQATDITINTGGIFAADIFSQNEVEEIAISPESQLVLIDTFMADEIASVHSEISNVQAKLSANAREIVPLQDSLAKLADELSKFPSVEEKIKGLSGIGDQNSQEIDQAQTHKGIRQREQKGLEDAGELIQDYLNWFTQGFGDFTAKVKKLFADDVLEGPNGDILKRVIQHLEKAGLAIDKLFQDGESLLVDEQNKLLIDTNQLRSAHNTQELAFRDLIAKHQQAQGQATERAKWETTRNELLASKREQTDKINKLNDLKQKRQQLMDQLSNLRDKRFGLRLKVAERITSEVASPVRVRIEQDGNRDLYFNMLVDALKDAQVQRNTVARKISQVLAPSELVEIIQNNDIESLQRHAGLNTSQASKTIMALGIPEVLLGLETVELTDLPRIELQDGDEWKESLSLSTGQKCTTILPILLLDSDSPLLVDQPEDNLDNKFIFHTVVDSLRKVKTSRQVTLITHNPNIPVLGDAEGVFVLTSDGQQSRLLNSGGVDNCRNQIIDLLEGGEEAFVQRKKRYNF